MIGLLTIAREKMGTHDFGGAGCAFLFAVFPLSLSSPYHKPRLKNISNKRKFVDYMAPMRKEIPPNGDESSS
jgi:hypothetical protein